MQRSQRKQSNMGSHCLGSLADVVLDLGEVREQGPPGQLVEVPGVSHVSPFVRLGGDPLTLRPLMRVKV